MQATPGWVLRPPSGCSALGEDSQVIVNVKSPSGKFTVTSLLVRNLKTQFFLRLRYQLNKETDVNSKSLSPTKCIRGPCSAKCSLNTPHNRVLS